mgnify:CR=1 FL=1
MLVSLPHKLSNGAAHRISNWDESGDTELVGECGNIIGAIRQSECLRCANATSVSAQVMCNDTKVFAKCFVTHEPVEIGGCSPPMQQHQSWRALGAGQFSVKRGATARKVDVLTFRKLWDEVLAQPSTFNTVTDTLAPFSNVMETLLPSDCPSRAEPIGETGLITSVPSPVRFSSMWPMR